MPWSLRTRQPGSSFTRQLSFPVFTNSDATPFSESVALTVDQHNDPGVPVELFWPHG